MKRYGPFVLVLAFAAFLRFYFIHYPMDLSIFPETLGYNGIDEGVHLMSGKLASDGWTMYEDVNPQQGPFVMMLYTWISGDILQARLITAVFSLIGIGAIMVIGRDLGGKWTGVISGILLLSNYEFLKESRHASADLFASVSLILAFLFIVKYLNSNSDRNRTFTYRSSLMVLSGIFLSISVMSKMFSIIPVFGLGAFFLFQLIRSRDLSKFDRRDELIDLMVLVVSVLATTVLLMSIFGFENTYRGIFLDNLHRPSQPLFDKFLIFGDFALFTAFPLFIGTWWAVKKRNDPVVRLLSLWTYPLLLLFLIQSLTWIHYYILVVPPLCILAAMPIGTLMRNGSERDGDATEIGPKIPSIWKKNPSKRTMIILFVIYVLLSTGFSTATVFGSHRPIEDIIADDIEDMTFENDMVVCGDPIIALMANRLQPPEATNIAEVRYPALTSEELIEIINDYNIRLVVFSYQLSTYEAFYEWVHGNWTFQKAYGRPDKIFDEWKEPNEGIYLLYTL